MTEVDILLNMKQLHICNENEIADIQFSAHDAFLQKRVIHLQTFNVPSMLNKI